MTQLQSFGRPLVMIGCGNMAGAILSRWLQCGLDPAQVTVVDPHRAEIQAGVTLLAALPARLPDDAVVVLGVKPQLLPEVTPVLAPLLGSGNLVISMLAGVTVDQLRLSLGAAPGFVRIMPNTPVALGQGVCAFYVDARTAGGWETAAQALLAPLGLSERIATEDAFDLVTALTGCGPAFVYRFIDAMKRGAMELGMEGDQAARRALATVRGAANLAGSVPEDPAVLADRVASKGGMTREGLDVLDADDRLVRLMADTLRAARDRGKELNALSG